MKNLITKTLLTLCLSLIYSWSVNGQEALTDDLKYDPTIDGLKQLNEAIQLVQGSQKHILVFVGGNWCPWCMKLNRYVHENKIIDSLIKADYIVVKLNYSKENKNPEALKRIGSPARFGFPVLAVVNERGTLLHIQDSGLLESGEGYDEKKVISFLRNWSYKAVRVQ